MSIAVLADSLLRLGARAWPANIGRGGVRGADKAEGDGATPLGYLPLRRVLYRADRIAPPFCAVPREPIGRDDGWCDDPSDAAYNRPVRLGGTKAERLWRDDPLYDVVGVLGWNDAPVVSGRGSAIFLHVARSDGAPTDGCIALPRVHLLAALAAGLTGIEVMPWTP